MIAVEHLDNGLWAARDRTSGLAGLWNADGSRRSGDLTMGRSARSADTLVRAAIMDEAEVSRAVARSIAR